MYLDHLLFLTSLEICNSLFYQFSGNFIISTSGFGFEFVHSNQQNGSAQCFPEIY